MSTEFSDVPQIAKGASNGSNPSLLRSYAHGMQRSCGRMHGKRIYFIFVENIKCIKVHEDQMMENFVGFFSIISFHDTKKKKN